MLYQQQFEREALAYFEAKVPRGYNQALDGIRCFSDLTRYSFLRRRLDRMVRKGLLRQSTVRSIWRSYNGTPTYGLPNKETT